MIELRISKKNAIVNSSEVMQVEDNSLNTWVDCVYDNCRDLLKATISELATIAEINPVAKDILVDTSVVLLELDALKTI